MTMTKTRLKFHLITLVNLQAKFIIIPTPLCQANRVLDIYTYLHQEHMTAEQRSGHGQQPEKIAEQKIVEHGSREPLPLLGISPVNFFRDLRQAGWRLPWVSEPGIKDMLKKEGQPLAEKLGEAPLPTEFGDWTYMAFGDYTSGSHHELLVLGNFQEDSLGDGEDVLVRMHSSCRTNETYHAVNCECRAELHQAMSLIQEEGRGVIVYLEQEGRGTGITGKLAQLNGMFGWIDGRIDQKRDPETGERIDTDRAYKEAGYPSECRDFDVAGEMLQSIGVTSVRLLTNNPRKIAGIESVGITVTPVSIHISPDNEIIASDLRSKRDNLGHSIPEEHLIIQPGKAKN